MAWSISWEGTPKGFVNEPGTTPPNKVNSYYVNGVFNGDLGQAWRNDSDERNYAMIAWLLLKSEPLVATTGKKLLVDFAIWGGPYYFNFTGPARQVANLEILFYDFISQSWVGNWTHYATYSIGNCSKSIPTPGNNYGSGGGSENAASCSYDYPGNCYSGAYKPAYGQSYSGSWGSYSDCVSANSGKSPTNWNDPSSSGAGVTTGAYVKVWPFGVRYITNDGKWGPNDNNLNAKKNGVITGNHQVNVNWTRSGQDGGKPYGSYKVVYIDEDFIRRACGRSTGITALKMRWTWDGDTWYYPYRYDGPNDFVMIDNPQLGLFDWGPAGSSQDWSPRFDAKAYGRGPGSGSGNELQGKYNPGGGNWSIF